LRITPNRHDVYAAEETVDTVDLTAGYSVRNLKIEEAGKIQRNKDNIEKRKTG
jgi:hypothetical protein